MFAKHVSKVIVVLVNSFLIINMIFNCFSFPNDLKVYINKRILAVPKRLHVLKLRKVQVKTVISHCNCDHKLKKKVVTISVTIIKKAGSHNLVMVSLGSQLFFGHIWNHSFNLDLPQFIYLQRYFFSLFLRKLV